MPIPSLFLYGLSLVAGILLVVYGLSQSSREHPPAPATDGPDLSIEPSCPTQNALRLDFSGTPPGPAEGELPEPMNLAAGGRGSAPGARGGILPRLAASVAKLVRSPLRSADPEQKPQIGEEFEKPLASGVVLEAKHSKGVKEPQGDKGESERAVRSGSGRTETLK